MTVDEKTSRYRYVILMITWIAYAAASASRLSIAPLGPYMIPDLRLSRAELGLFYSFTYLGYICAQVPAGWFIDRFSIRSLLVIMQIALAGTNMLMSVISTPIQGWLVEFLTGIEAGSLIACATKAVVIWFPTRERATAMGVQQASLNLGGMGAAFLLPIIAVTQGWRASFAVLSGIAIVSSVLSLAFFKQPLPATQAAQPAASKSTFREVLMNRDIVLVAIGAMLFGIIEFCLIMNLVLFLHESILLSAVVASSYLAVVEGAGALGKPLFGLVSDRLLEGRRRPVLIAVGIACLTCSIWTTFMLRQSSSWIMTMVLALFGLAALGWGGLFLALTAELARKELSGVATGFGLTLTCMGIIIGPPVFGSIVDRTGSYELAWAFVAICAAAGTAVFSLTKEKRRM